MAGSQTRSGGPWIGGDRRGAEAPREIGARTGAVLQGRYMIGALLGRGGMGEVYEAHHVVVGRRFAVKFLRGDLGRNEKVLARFRREAQAAGGLNHDNIAGVFDFGTTDDGDPYIVLEYLEGEDLARCLERGPLPVRTAAAVALQATSGLAAAHQRGIVHRDLKPANLFVCRQSDGLLRIKLLDFGIAKLHRGDRAERAGTRSRSPAGTPQYMSPEQILDPAAVDQRTDIYAVGAILYESLAGAKPHPGELPTEIMEHVAHGDVTPLGRLCPEVAPGLAEIVDRAMARAPGDRFPTARAMAAALAPFAATVLSSRGPGALPIGEPRVALHASPTTRTAYSAATHETASTRAPDPTVVPAPRSRLPAVTIVATIALGVVGSTGLWAVRRARAPQAGDGRAAVGASSSPAPTRLVAPAPRPSSAVGTAVPSQDDLSAAPSRSIDASAGASTRPALARGPSPRNGSSMRGERAARSSRADRRSSDAPPSLPPEDEQPLSLVPDSPAAPARAPRKEAASARAAEPRLMLDRDNPYGE